MRMSLMVVLLSAAAGQVSGAAPNSVVIEVAAGRHDRQNTIVSFDLPEQLHSRGKFTSDALGQSRTDRRANR